VRHGGARGFAGIVPDLRCIFGIDRAVVRNLSNLAAGGSMCKTRRLSLSLNEHARRGLTRPDRPERVARRWAATLPAISPTDLGPAVICRSVAPKPSHLSFGVPSLLIRLERFH